MPYNVSILQKDGMFKAVIWGEEGLCHGIETHGLYASEFGAIKAAERILERLGNDNYTVVKYPQSWSKEK